MAEGFELGDEASLACGAVASFVEVVAAEVVVGFTAGEQMPADDQDRVPDCDRGPAGSALATDAVVLGGQVGVLRSASGLAGFDECDA